MQQNADASPVTGQLTRRDALKRGAVVGGALVWAVPAMQSMSVGTADAASGTVPPPGPQPAACIPSHGLLLVRTAGGVLVGIKVDEDGSIDGIPAKNGDAEFLGAAPRGYSGWVKPSAAGITVSGGKAAGGTALYLVVPTGTTFVGAWTADGNLSGGPGSPAGLDYAAVTPVSGRVTFSKAC
ncbi:twin-arginine translocation signal domain-containing protein [Motilibacter deserti]|uniref:Twin-arginine translocation signal domain-containing protein n=1 Tax=Motilibacter deserti TaxID=2714956 RepID=A0ABX0GPN3_9ACTN|nr:twin-arginine translocation signal domain-containing protein [Motilibacter deserti]NHC12784.1 twin-arginine translocation signal domain-containing protein [Motilibacter deserti]